MFNVSTKFLYGINAVLDLAEKYGKGLTQIKNIARRKKIPQNYLVQIFNKLAKTGLVKGIPGVNGGYKLSLPPEQISVLRVLEALEGKINFCDKMDKKNPVFSLFAEAEKNIKTSLNVSLKDLLEKQKKINRQIIYYI